MPHNRKIFSPKMTLCRYINQSYPPIQIIDTKNVNVHCTEAFTLQFKKHSAPSYDQIKKTGQEYYQDYGRGSFKLLDEQFGPNTKVLEAYCSSFKIFGFDDIEARVALMHDSRKKYQDIIEVRCVEQIRIKPPQGFPF